MDDSFDRVADFEKLEEVEIPILAVQLSTLKVPQPSEGQKKKRIKTPVGRTDLPLVRQFKAMQAEASSSPLQPKSSKPKLTPNHQESPFVSPHKAFQEL